MQGQLFPMIHFIIKQGYIDSLVRSLAIISRRDLNRVYVFWTPLNFAKHHLNLAKTFNKNRVLTALKVYYLVRDYTLYHAIKSEDLSKVRHLLTSHNEKLDLYKRLIVTTCSRSIFKLAESLKNKNDKTILIYNNLVAFGRNRLQT